MVQTTVYNKENQPNEQEQHEISDFLFTHLDQYGDPQEHINNAINYTLQRNGGNGGFTLVAREDGKIKGATVVNATGMSGYIPENILVYIATHADHRGEGLGTKVMTAAIEAAEGDIALHVDADNPAKRLYEKLGFTNPYLEMRLKKGQK